MKPGFDAIQNALQMLGTTVDAAESHGTLCGLLLDNASLANWIEHTLDEQIDRNDVLAGEALQLLEVLFVETREKLNTEDLSFELLLPNDSDDLGVRLLGLSQWCQGFLYSIGLLGAGRLESLDAQSQECLSDLLEISKLNPREASTEESETQFAEVSEHVRLSVLLLNESMNPLMPAPSLQ